MKQRVGIARALAMEPKVLLLDEPFGALDALTRAHLQDEVIRIQSELGNTVMMITHDVDEAVLMSDRVVMMTNGPAATIGQILTVPLPRPRNRIALAEDHVYNHCRQEILSFLYEKQRKVEPISTARCYGARPRRHGASGLRRLSREPRHRRNSDNNSKDPSWPQSCPWITAPRRRLAQAGRAPRAGARRASRSASTARSSSRWRSSCCSTWACWC